MTAILSAIYCWLQGFFLSLNDWVLSWWDSLLSIVDGLLEAVGSGGFGAIPSIAQEYARVLGAMGVSQALAILATAMGTRFLLQSIPFVRWGGPDGRGSAGDRRWRTGGDAVVRGEVLVAVPGGGPSALVGEQAAVWVLSHDRAV